MESASTGRATGHPDDLRRVAADLLAALHTHAPDVGDDRTQSALDDVLESLERRLARLAGEPA